ncbi:MAG: hypothetical protein AABX04_01150 [Nanoarchaeota archaeon]
MTITNKLKRSLLSVLVAAGLSIGCNDYRPVDNQPKMPVAEAEQTAERTYSLTLPIRDNSGNEISSAAYQHLGQELSDHFGGVSIQPHTFGCWYDSDNKKLQCEENKIFYSSRDCEDKQSLQDKFGTDNCAKIREIDRNFVNDIAKEYGAKLGQSSVYVQESWGSVSFVEGERKEKLPEELLKKAGEETKWSL